MRTLLSKHNSQKGQSLTEMAISMVILLILIAGIFDVGRAIFTYMSMRDAAQEGAAYASIEADNFTEIVNRTDANIDYFKSIVVDMNGTTCATGTPDPLDPSTPITIITGNCDASDGCAGHEARVTVALDLPITTPFIGAFIGSQSISLRATATDTILRPYCK